jgi:hypothetical protein
MVCSPSRRPMWACSNVFHPTRERRCEPRTMDLQAFDPERKQQGSWIDDRSRFQVRCPPWLTCKAPVWPWHRSPWTLTLMLRVPAIVEGVNPIPSRRLNNSTKMVNIEYWQWGYLARMANCLILGTSRCKPNALSVRRNLQEGWCSEPWKPPQLRFLGPSNSCHGANRVISCMPILRKGRFPSNVGKYHIFYFFLGIREGRWGWRWRLTRWQTGAVSSPAEHQTRNPWEGMIQISDTDPCPCPCCVWLKIAIRMRIKIRKSRVEYNRLESR